MFDCIGLTRYITHGKWANTPFTALGGRVARPGCQAPTRENLLQADKEIWHCLVENTKGGIKPCGTSIPLEGALEIALQDPDVLTFLRPTQTGRPQHTATASNSDSNIPKELARIKQERSALQRKLSKGGKGKGQHKTRVTPRVKSKADKRKGKGKGKKGERDKKPKGQGGAVPAQFPEGVSQKDGSFLCCGYSNGTCKACKKGKSCTKNGKQFKHTCFHKDCDKVHPYYLHH